MIGAAAGQLGELVDELSLGARIEAGRYDPVLKEVDSLELARHAAERLGEERVIVEGTGATVELDADASERAVRPSRSARSATEASSRFASTCAAPS